MAEIIQWIIVAAAVIVSIIYLARKLRPSPSGKCGNCGGCKLSNPKDCSDYKPPKL